MMRLAYGAPFQVQIALVDGTNTPISVVGWTARADIEHFDDRSTWSPALSLSNSSITNGGAAGTLTLQVTAPQTTALASTFGSPTPNRLARLSFYGTPSGGTELLLFQQHILVLPVGAAVQPFSQNVTMESFTVDVSALAAIPSTLVSNTTPGIVSTLQNALSRHVNRSDGTALVESLERVPAAAFTPEYATDALRLAAATAIAGAGFKDLQLEAKNYAVGYLDMRNFQGVRLLGCGGSSFSTGGTTFTLQGTSPGGDVTGTSSSSVSIGSDPRGSVTKSFTIPGLVGVIANYPMSATATAGATGAMYGDVVSYDGTTLVMKSLAQTGSGTGTSWSILCTTRPWIDYRSCIGSGLKDVNVIVPAGSIHRVIDTSWNPANVSDASIMVFDHVKIRQADRKCRAFYFGNTIGVIATHCSVNDVMCGMFVGNGPCILLSNNFNGHSVWAMELLGAENFAAGNVFEPGTALNGVSDRLINFVKSGPNSFGTATLIANVCNDVHPDALGDIVFTTGMRTLTSIGNQYQSDAPQAVVRVSGTERVGFYGDVFNGAVKGVEVDLSGSTVQTIYKSADVSFGSGLVSPVWLTGAAKVVDSIDESATIVRTDGSGITGLSRNFAKLFFLYTTYDNIVAETPINLVTGVDLSATSGNVYNSYTTGPGHIYTLAAIDDGLCIDFTNDSGQTVTIHNNNTTGSAGGVYRKVLTGTGADVVIAAGSVTAPRNFRLRYRSRLSAFVLENVYP